MVAAAVFCAGCEQPADVRVGGDMGWWDESRSESLRHNLLVFQNNFEDQVEDSAMKILRESTARNVRLAALRWRTRLPDQLEQKTREPNAMVALLDAWTLTMRQMDYFTKGEGKELFGEHQQIAIDSATCVQNDARKLADDYIPEIHREQLEKQITEYAAKHPFVGLFEQTEPASLSTDKSALDTFGQILMLPLAPFASADRVGKGVQDFNVTASRFTDTLGDLPAETRWQLEVLLSSTPPWSAPLPKPRR
jgi:hypothetical protein